ncbi:galactose-binding domain-containing protein [Flavivirga eckloniae]|uniref:F5/8 type C domain-containing protein n=1 Tax=Flavivirga eckloniae TaxID=1803846 RepID=A0A2K9PLQ0_9FLAO|nr:T9SS type A sorting domain-containing protein [Flavivirga eckloniae]AUP77955.1 hypothetical protein C1H87_04200 [Flavivirga eckloniae]
MPNHYYLFKKNLLIRGFLLLIFQFFALTAWSQVLISGATGNGNFENISPSDAPIQNAVRRAANSPSSFTIPDWTIKWNFGYIGVDGVKGGSNGLQYAFVNQSSSAAFLTDTINNINVTKGKGLKLSFKATDVKAGGMAHYDVSYIINGEELKLARKSVTVVASDVYQDVEFKEQLFTDLTSIAIKIELRNNVDGATGGQPRFDDVILEVVPDTGFPPFQDRYFVSTTGNDINSGTIDSPFRTIQKAADVAQYGSTIEIRGGTYHEKVIVKKSGLSGNPITFKAYNNEKVVVSTCDPVTGWVLATGDTNQDGSPDTDVWSTTMNWDAGEDLPPSERSRWIKNDASFNNTMFVNGVLRYPARERGENNPVYVDDWGIIPYGAMKHEGFTAPELAGWPDNFWNGAQVYHHSSDWSAQYSEIGDYNPDGKVTFSSPLTYFPSQKMRFGYFITGTIKAMNRPHEWFKALGNNTLYYKAESGVDPNSLEIEMKKRDFTFDLQGAQNIEIKGIIHRGGGPTSFTPCKNFVFQENEVYGINENNYGYMRILGDNVKIISNTFKRTHTSVFQADGDRWDIVNNLFEDISYQIDATGVEISSSSSRFLISYNTFSGVGRGVFRFYPLKSIISYNLFEKFCRNSWDTALLDGDSESGQGGGTLVHHNIFRDAPIYNRDARGPGTNGSGFAAFYSGLDLTVYRNIVLDVGTEATIRSRLSFHNFYHNTFISKHQGPWVDNMGRPPIESSYQNNLQLNLERIVTPGLTVDGNINYTASDFVDLAGNDIRLSMSSAAIDKGVLIPGINDTYIGDAPDVGALEYGSTIWKTGHDFNAPPSVIYDYKLPKGSNLIGDGGFTDHSEWDFVYNSSPFNSNQWNHGALGPYGKHSLKLWDNGVIEGVFDNLKPNKTYEIGVEALLVYPAIYAHNYTSINGSASTGNHRSEGYITGLADGESTSYANIDFGDGTIFDHAELSFASETTISTEMAKNNNLELRIGSPAGALLATMEYREAVSDVWAISPISKFSTASPSGLQTIYLVPKGPDSESMRISSIRFLKERIETSDKFLVQIEGHGYEKEISPIGKSSWTGQFEKMMFHTGNSVGNVKVSFKNSGPYEVYIGRAYLSEISDYENIAPNGTSIQSSTFTDKYSSNAHDGVRNQQSATTNPDALSFWQLELPYDETLEAVRISSSGNVDDLENVRLSLYDQDPGLGAGPLLSRDYVLSNLNLNGGQSLYASIFDWVSDEGTIAALPLIKYVRIERLDGKALSLSEVEAITFNDHSGDFSSLVKNENEWKYTFTHEFNPTHITVVNSNSAPVESMKIVVRDASEAVVWEKTYEGVSFNIPQNERYEIPGNEISADGVTRLASVLGYSISVEKVGGILALRDFRVYDGNFRIPLGNLAIAGSASHIGNFYRSSGFAEAANNGYLFPKTDFTSSEKTANPWWELKLDKVSDIDQIVLWNRKDAGYRIGNFRVSVLNDSRQTIWSKNYSFSNGDLANDKSLTIDIDHSNARYVRVQSFSSQTLLHLAEVQIWPKSGALSLLTLQNNNYKVYPNPCKDQIHIKGSQFSQDDLEYRIIDISGKEVFKGTVKNNNAFRIPNIDNGLYILEIRNDNRTYFKKILVQK